MNSYKSNYKYNALFSFGIAIVIFLLASGSIEALMGDYISSLTLFLLAVVLAYLLLFVFAKEIDINEKGITYKTILKTTYIAFPQIKHIKPYYTSRSLTLAGGDKEKAEMFVRIKLKKKPFKLYLFGSAISNYKELYSLILHIAKPHIMRNRE